MITFALLVGLLLGYGSARLLDLMAAAANAWPAGTEDDREDVDLGYRFDYPADDRQDGRGGRN